MDQTRRSMLALLPALCAGAAFTGEAAAAPAPAENVITTHVLRFRDLPVHGNENLFRPIVHGETHLHYPLEVHETTLQPGSMPHPAHHHLHEEMFLVREGHVQVTVNGQPKTIGPGGAAYIASNDVHGIKNVGATPATYFVIEIGGDKR